MKKFLSLIVCIVLLLGSLFAQDECGTKSPHQLLKERTDISEMEKQKLIEEYRLMDIAIKEKLSKKNYKRDDTTTYVIPVVFHIIHENGEENVPNDYIYASLELMNLEFNAQNDAIDQVVPQFQDRIGNANMRFQLATIDPEGNCTSGIERYYDPELTNCQVIECNLRAKAKYHWPRDKYMNFYVVKSIASGVAGFSFFPFDYPQNGYLASQDSLDGNSVTAASLSRTVNDAARSVCSHEAGHWFGLYHTWGKSDNVALPENCNEDDDVDDTPNCMGASSCNKSLNSCNSGTNDLIDNVQNYMDYADCRAMFTEGQTDRMRGVLENVSHRKNLWQPANLAATGTDYSGLPQGLCQAEFTVGYNYLTSTICEGTSVQFSDQSTNVIDSRVWYFEGGIPATSTEANPTITYPNPGSYGVKLVVYNGADSVSITREEIIQVENKEDLRSLVEPFEEVDVLNDYVATVNEFGWQHTQAAAQEGSGSIYINNYDGPSGAEYVFTTKTFDLTNEWGAELRFYYAFARTNSTNIDEIKVQISTDCGLTWNTRRTLKGSKLSTLDFVANEPFIPTANDWKEFDLDLTSYANQSGLRVRLLYTSGDGNNLYIDNFQFNVLTSVKELSLAERAKLVPNPARTVFQVENFEWQTLEIIDITGKTVKVFHIASGNTIDISDLELGTYLVKVENTRHQTQVLKLICAK